MDARSAMATGGIHATRGATPFVPLAALWQRFLRVAVPLCAVAILALAVRTVGAPLSLLAICLIGACMALLIWPDTATLIVAALLYMNVPAVAHNLHHVPQTVAASVFVLLGLPFVHHVIFLRGRPHVDFVLKLMLAYLGVMVLSSLAAPDLGIAMHRVTDFVLEGIVAYFLFTTVVRSLAMLRRVLYAVLLAGALLGSLTVYQAVTGSYQHKFAGLAMPQSGVDEAEDPAERRQTPAVAPSAEPQAFGAEDRASGPMLNTNYYAQIMLVLLPLAVFLVKAERQRRRQLAVLVMGAVILVGGVVLTYSRGAVLVLPALGIAAVWFRWVGPRPLLLAAAACLVGSLVFAPALYTRLTGVATVFSLQATGANKDADVSVRGRATEMLAGLLAFRDHPLLGVGPGQYAPFYSVRYGQNPDIKFKTLQEARAAHSLYVQVAAESGVFGLVLFIAMPVWLVRQLWRERLRLSHRPVLADLAAALTLSIIAYHGAGLFLSFAYERYYWFLLALGGAALATLRATPADGEPANGANRWTAHAR